MRTHWLPILLVASSALADPDGAAEREAHLKKAYDLERQNKWPEAVAEFDAALESQLSYPDRRPDIRVYAELGRSAMQAGDLAKAREADVRAVEVAKNLPDDRLEATALFHLGLVEEKSGEILSAKRSFEASLALAANPAAVAELTRLGNVAAKPTGCYDTVEQVLPPHRGLWMRDGKTVRSLRNDSWDDDAWYCDTPARVVVAEITGRTSIDAQRTRPSGTLYTLNRRTGAVAATPLASSSRCVDKCAPDGYAGCSRGSGCDLRSGTLGARALNAFSDGHWIGNRPALEVACGGDITITTRMICSTANHLAIIGPARAQQCSDDQQVLRIDVFDSTVARKHDVDGYDEEITPLLSADGDRDSSTAAPTYRFANVTLAITPGAQPTATLAIGKVSEDCLVLAF
jgi:hypothetical protein